MNRSSARLRAAFALVVAVGLAVLGAVAWTTHEESVRLDETAGWAERTRTSVAAVQAVSLAALDAEAAQRSYLLGAQNRHDIQSFADAMAATGGQRFDEQVVASREVRHRAETDAGVMLALLVALSAISR